MRSTTDARLGLALLALIGGRALSIDARYRSGGEAAVGRSSWAPLREAGVGVAKFFRGVDTEPCVGSWERATPRSYPPPGPGTCSAGTERACGPRYAPDAPRPDRA